MNKLGSFRVMLFRMVPKQPQLLLSLLKSFRVMLFRMVPKLAVLFVGLLFCFRIMLFGFRRYDMIDVKISLICINVIVI